MSKKDYEAMAAELAYINGIVLSLARSDPGFTGISNHKGADTLETILYDVTRSVANVFRENNERFDVKRFMAAAGFPA